jgi:hypothetical protein
MTGPPTRGKKNSTTPGKFSDQDWEATEDSQANEELSKFKEEVKKDMCDLRGDILDIRSMLSTYIKETRKEHSINQGETSNSTNDDTNFNPTGSRNFFPKVDMRKFDGKDPLTWINQMEIFFEVHQIPYGQKVTISSLYLELDQFIWYHWLCTHRRKKGLTVTWSIFTEELQAQYSNSVVENFFSQLAKLQQIGSVKDYIQQFQNLSLRVDTITEENLDDLFMGGLKDHIQPEVGMFCPSSINDTFTLARRVEEKFLISRKQGANLAKEKGYSTPYLPQPTRLTPQQIAEKREKGLCFNCDSKYSRGHKCNEKKLFYIEGPSEEEEDEPISEENKELGEESHDSQPIISCHALSGFMAPQTLKVVGFLKKQKVTVLIDSGSTHNFINKKLATCLNCFIYPAPEFQVLIADGGTVSCSGKCHSIKLSMGDYQLDTPMYAISMGAADIVLGVQWLTTLGTIEMNFQELFM